MPEADALVPGLTGVEYVSLAGELYGMPRREAQRRAHEVLSYLELEEARYRRVEEYSTGMKQRAKLAQALVHDPPVLLLDEPTSGLDPAGRDAMLRLVVALGKDHGKSVILSTHLLADVEAVCQRVVILAGGRVRGEGTVSELCARRLDRYRLRVQGDANPFRDGLVSEGVTLLADNGQGDWRVAVPARLDEHRVLQARRRSTTSRSGPSCLTMRRWRSSSSGRWGPDMGLETFLSPRESTEQAFGGTGCELEPRDAGSAADGPGFGRSGAVSCRFWVKNRRNIRPGLMLRLC